MHYHYTQKVKEAAGKDYENYDEQLAGVYEDTVVNGGGLYLMLVRNSSNHAEIQTSEYCSECAFDSDQIFTLKSTLLIDYET